eukprot:1186951-Rhodomonas_salina.1
MCLQSGPGSPSVCEIAAKKRTAVTSAACIPILVFRTHTIQPHILQPETVFITRGGADVLPVEKVQDRKQ